MKKTAVEWLVEQVNADCLNSTFIRNELVDEARAMEKEQIVNAACEFMGTTFDPNKGRAELYYNETYGGDK